MRVTLIYPSVGRKANTPYVKAWQMQPLSMALLAGLSYGTGTADTGSGKVTIRRTAYGIPHILADDFAGAGFGLGYAFAEDNFCALADITVTVGGDRSRYFGADTNAGDPMTFYSPDHPMPLAESVAGRSRASAPEIEIQRCDRR